MKIRITLLSTILFLSYILQAQQIPSKLDSIFMNLNPADISTGILYDKTYRLGKAETFEFVNYDIAINMHHFKQNTA